WGRGDRRSHRGGRRGGWALSARRGRGCGRRRRGGRGLGRRLRRRVGRRVRGRGRGGHGRCPTWRDCGRYRRRRGRRRGRGGGRRNGGCRRRRRGRRRRVRIHDLEAVHGCAAGVVPGVGELHVVEVPLAHGDEFGRVATALTRGRNGARRVR